MYLDLRYLDIREIDETFKIIKISGPYDDLFHPFKYLFPIFGILSTLILINFLKFAI